MPNIQLERVGIVQISFLHLPKPSAEFVADVKTFYDIKHFSDLFTVHLVSVQGGVWPPAGLSLPLSLGGGWAHRGGQARALGGLGFLGPPHQDPA